MGEILFLYVGNIEEVGLEWLIHILMALEN